jgi:regulator of CtrA degradation
LWQQKPMHSARNLDPGLHRRLTDSLYVEAMVMADEARAYFDGPGNADRDRLDMIGRVAFSCESLKVTTRLMHVIAWLLTQRAWQRGEISGEALRDPRYLLGDAAATDMGTVSAFAFAARALIDGSSDLYHRVARLQAAMGLGGAALRDAPVESPARALLDRLEKSL